MKFIYYILITLSCSLFSNEIEYCINLIRNSDITDLKNPSFLENELLPKLGFNNESLHEFPSTLYPYCGSGLKSWQYPSQFSKFLVYLSDKNISSYLEIGCRHGGTFIIITEYLKRFNKNIKTVGIDPFYSENMSEYVKKINDDATYIIDYSHNEIAKNFIKNNKWDLCLIDGDHSYEGVLNDYNLVKDNSKIIAFHDIVSDVCPGVVNMWKEIKINYPNNVIELIQQYPEVQKKMSLNYLGIGILDFEKK